MPGWSPIDGANVVGGGRHPDPRGGPWLQPDSLGIAVHEVVAQLARARPTQETALSAAVHAALARRGTRNPALRARLTSFGAIWLSCFDPPAGWALQAVEPVVGSGRPDLLWRAHDGQLWLDELKTGEASLATGQQTQRYLRDAQRVYAAELGGIRLVLLSVPALVLITSDGKASVA